jgi:hypothetical protein
MREQIIAFLQTMLPDNALRTITAQRLRDFFTEFIHAFIMVPRGNFLLGTQYEKNDLVVFDGSSFFCKQPNNNQPVTNTDVWGLMVSKGDTGAPKWRGAWSSATAYAIGDSVYQNGNSYISKTAHTNQAVTNTTHWDIVAAKGESGLDGENVRNLSGGLIQNSSLESFAFQHIDIGSGVTLDGQPGVDLFPSLLLQNTTGQVAITFTKRVYVDFAKLYKVSLFANQISGSPCVISGRMRLYDQNNNLVNFGRGDVSSAYSSRTIDALNEWKKHNFFWAASSICPKTLLPAFIRTR